MIPPPPPKIKPCMLYICLTFLVRGHYKTWTLDWTRDDHYQFELYNKAIAEESLKDGHRAEEAMVKIIVSSLQHRI